MSFFFQSGATKDALRMIVERVRAANMQIAADSAMLVDQTAARHLHLGYGVRSGTMRRSGHVEGPIAQTPDRVYANVGPTVIYARRFELGFVGPDSLGRTFPYRPRPYWRPAYEESRPMLNTIATRRWGQAIREVTG